MYYGYFLSIIDEVGKKNRINSCTDQTSFDAHFMENIENCVMLWGEAWCMVETIKGVMIERLQILKHLVETDATTAFINQAAAAAAAEDTACSSSLFLQARVFSFRFVSLFPQKEQHRCLLGGFNAHEHLSNEFNAGAILTGAKCYLISSEIKLITIFF